MLLGYNAVPKGHWIPTAVISPTRILLHSTNLQKSGHDAALKQWDLGYPGMQHQVPE